MSNITLNPEVATIITAAVSAVQSATRKMASSIDALVAADMRSTDFISPKSDGSTSSPEQFDGINTAIMACKNEIELADAITSLSHDIDQLLTKAVCG